MLKGQLMNGSSAPQPRSARAAADQGGFSLVEVLVALIVIAIGLLGIAKLEALALSSTNTAGTRSLAALEASSLAATMHADRDYWAAGLAPAMFTVRGGNPGASGALSISDAGLASALTSAGQYGCTSASGRPQPYCTPVEMAAWDLSVWAKNLPMPDYLATVSCSQTVGVPVDCSIRLQWAERATAINSQEATYAEAHTASPAAFQNPTYVLDVEP